VRARRARLAKRRLPARRCAPAAEKIVVNEDEAAVYRQIIEWVIEGRGPAWIANRLTKDGDPWLVFPTRRRRETPRRRMNNRP
jgi:hypothetical protein